MTTGNATTDAKPSKRCFVTIGATAPFDGLIKAVLDDKFVVALEQADYTELRIQYGSVEGQTIYDDRFRRLADKTSIVISGFDFKQEGLREEMIQLKSDTSRKRHEGVVFSHAGSGSILDALRVAVPLVVVPNTDLLHNHQLELAEELAKQHYVVHGKLSDLAASIAEIERHRVRMNQWPPATSGAKQQHRNLATVMDEEMGWID